MSGLILTPTERKAYELAARFAAFSEVTAVALGGSQSSGAADAGSDIDLYIYTRAGIPPNEQAMLIEQSGGAIRVDLGLSYWGGVNVWIDASTGITVDCMYWDVRWIEGEIARVMEAHQPSLGYSTSFCRTVMQSRVLYDPNGWFAALQVRSGREYPEPLRRNIVAHNHPVLRGLITSYLHQIESAVRRQDAVSVNHRVAALLTSYFDIIFALNRVLHPGEKRLLAFAQRECAVLPTAMAEDVGCVLTEAGTASGAVVTHIGRLLDRLDEALEAAGFDLGRR